jgi:hypothetical protein
MIKVSLELVGWTAPAPEIPECNGRKSVVIEVCDGATVHDMFITMAVKYPALVRDIYDLESRKINSRINMFVNGEFIIPAGIPRYKLHDGDSLLLLPVLEGG